MTTRLAATTLMIILLFPLALSIVAPSENLEFTTASTSTQTTITLTSTDDITHSQAYYSIDGSQWQPLPMQGQTLDTNWKSGAVTGQFSINKQAQQQSVYLIAFTCSLENNAWNCHGNDWQLHEAIVPAQGPEENDPAPVDGNAWSDAATWSSMGMSVPQAGDVVMIPQGARVVLDVSTPNLDGIMVEGSLEFADRDLSLTTDYIKVMGQGAELIIGTEADPFESELLITLTGTEQEILNAEADRVHCGHKVICSMNGGRLEIIGAYAGPAWTRLADGNTANPGDTQIRLEESVNWQVGDEIVIAPTDFDAGLAEKRTITAVNGNVVSFSQPLEFMHYGEEYCKHGYCIDMRAEVVHLTRNIKIQGNAASENSRMGGHVMAMNEHASQQFQRFGGGEEFVDLWQEYDNSDFAKPKISGVELYRMGQESMIARYPWHWHMYGDAGGSYVKDSSVHESYSRCYTIHGTQGARLENNVAFNVHGHCVFLEDGAEWDNTITNNAIVLVRPYPTEAARLHESDVIPSAFWWVNSDNAITNNVAAGVYGFGFWLDPQPHPVGPSATEQIELQPINGAAFGTFSGNTAHSTTSASRPADAPLLEYEDTIRMNGGGVGLMVGGHSPQDSRDSVWFACTRHQSPNGQRCDFTDGTYYYNDRAGVWFNSAHTWSRAIDSVIAESPTGAFHGIAHEEGLTIFSLTDNTGNPGKLGTGIVELKRAAARDNQATMEDQRAAELHVGRPIPGLLAVVRGAGERGGTLNSPIKFAGMDWQYDGAITQKNVFIDYDRVDDEYQMGAMTLPGNALGMYSLRTTMHNSEPYLPHSKAKSDRQTVFIDVDGTLSGTGSYSEFRQHYAQTTPGSHLIDDTCTRWKDQPYYLCNGRSARFHSLDVDLEDPASITQKESGVEFIPKKNMWLPSEKTYRLNDQASNNIFFQVDEISADNYWYVEVPTTRPLLAHITEKPLSVRESEVDIVNSMQEFNSGTNVVTIYHDANAGIQHIKMRGEGVQNPTLDEVWAYTAQRNVIDGYRLELGP